MQRFIVRKLFEAVITLLGLSLIVFSAVHLSGDPARYLMPSGVEGGEEVYRDIRQRLGLDKPFLVQYVIFLKNVFTRFDFGRSITDNRPVRDLIMERLPNTVQLGGVALVFAVLLGVPLGILSAVKRDTIFDKSGKLIAIFGMAAPQFWLAIMLIILFGAKLQWLPVYGKGGILHLILPAFVIALTLVAAMMRLGRSSMLEILDSEYIKFARVKGLKENLIIWKHAARNAIIPLLTFGGLALAGVFHGVVVVEQVFAWPGMGRLMLGGVLERNMPVVQGTVLTAGFFYIAVALIIDILYVYVDPRIRYD